MKRLKAFLVEKHGLSADADDAAVTKLANDLLAAGTLSQKKFLKLTTDQAPAESPWEKLGAVISNTVDAAIEKRFGKAGATATLDPPATTAAAPTAEQIAADAKALAEKLRVPDSAVQPGNVLRGAAANAASGNVDVKRASLQYDDSRTAKCYTHKHDAMKAFYASKGLMDRPILDGSGREVNHETTRDKALVGSFFQKRAMTNLGRPMNDHQADLFEECLEKELFVGDVYDPQQGKTIEIVEPRRLTEGERHAVKMRMGTKTLGLGADTGTTGGGYLVPYKFDIDVVTFPLLVNELFPMADVRDIDGTNQVIGGTFANLAINEGPTEADTTALITLNSTTALVTQLLYNIYPATGALVIGRDFLSDSPVKVQELVFELYKLALAQWLDKEIATGAGTAGMTGLTHTSGPGTFTFANGSAGPMTTKDIVNYIFTLPKKYRFAPGARCAFVMHDTLFKIARGMTVNGSTDIRLIYGYDLAKYSLDGYPVKINNDMTAVQSHFLDFQKMRVWRRKGVSFEVTDDGQTLRLVNEALITVRSRWGGKIVDPAAQIYSANSSKS